MPTATDYRIILPRCFRFGFNPTEAHQQVVSLMRSKSPFTAMVYSWFDLATETSPSTMLLDADVLNREVHRSSSRLLKLILLSPYEI